MLSSFMTTWNMEVIVTTHSILWLPLILLAIDKIIAFSSSRGRSMRRVEGSSASDTNKTIPWWLIGLGGLVFSILSGYWQTTLYVMAVSSIYAIYRIASLYGIRALIINHQLLIIYLWIPLALGLTSFHLLPTWELFNRSSRPSVNSSERLQNILKGYLLPARHLVTLFAPDYFGHPTTRNYFANVGGGTYYEHALFTGTIVLFLAMVAVTIAIGTKKIDVIFWLIVGVVAASFSFKTPWAIWVYDANIPVLSTGIANRILFVPAFSLSFLAAAGLDELIKGRGRKQLLLVSLIFILAVSVLFGVTIQNKTSLGSIKKEELSTLYLTSVRNMVIPAAVLSLGIILLLISRKKESRNGINFCLILLLVAGQNLYQHYKFTPFSEPEFTYPQHSTLEWLKENAGINRFIGYNGQFLNDNFATYYGLYTVEGYDSLNDLNRAMFIKSAVDGKLDHDLPTSADVALDRNLKNERAIKLMKLFGIKYLVDHPQWIDVGPTSSLNRLPDDKQKLMFSDGDWKIWEYLDAYPRAFLVGSYETIRDDQKLVDRFYASDFDPRSSVLISEPLPGNFSIVDDETSKVEIKKYTPTKIVFDTFSSKDQLLVLSDTYYPGWQARLENGKLLPVLTADYAVRAIPIPSGNHTITMWYFPDSLKKGLVIALFSLSVVIAITRFRQRIFHA